MDKQYLLAVSDPQEALRGHGLALLKITPETKKLFRLWRDCLNRLDDVADNFIELVVSDDLATTWYEDVNCESPLFEEATSSIGEGYVEIPSGSGVPEWKPMGIEQGPYAHILRTGVYFAVYVGMDKVEIRDIVDWNFLLEA